MSRGRVNLDRHWAIKVKGGFLASWVGSEKKASWKKAKSVTYSVPTKAAAA